MRIHILGICGTFMGSLALLARAAGHEVTGVDGQTYPPMNTLLAREGIVVSEGYDQPLPHPAPDLVLIGNALSRGNPQVEAVLHAGLPYFSGPEWLSREILQGRWVLAVAGTHGKTTTTAMLAWILDQAGLKPGFLIGGETRNFGVSARLGDSPFFVIEADEYDTAFFDKRAKFVHYRPRTLILNNLEYDHADIYPDLGAIETQFHHLLRTVPDHGLVLQAAEQPALVRVVERGLWSERIVFGADDGWWVAVDDPGASSFRIMEGQTERGQVSWNLSGVYNAQNALGAILAARHAGVPVAVSCMALSDFGGVRRRLEWRGTADGVAIYDDFAHHPTAIAVTLQALRGRVAQGRLVAVLEPRSNTMKLGVHRDRLGASLDGADLAYLYAPQDLSWDLRSAVAGAGRQVFPNLDDLLQALLAELRAGDHVLIMSNGGFGALHQRLLDGLAQREAST